MPDLYTSDSLADTLGVSRPTATRLIREGRIASLSDGKRRLVPQDALDAYLAATNTVPVPPDHARRTSERPPIVALSFFSGALGLDVGMERAGIPAMLLCEFDRKCRMTIEANRPDAALVGDITSTTADDVRRLAGLSTSDHVDVVFGGPPCQSFSTAGARRAFGDSRGNVFLRYLDIAQELEPTYLVIENVRGLLSTAWPLAEGGKPVRGGAMAYVLTRLESMGYTPSFELYNAANFGAPQIRERVVVIAKRGGKVGRLTPTNSNDPAWGLAPWHTFGEAVDGLTECHHTEFPEERARFLRMLGEGQYWKDLPADVQPIAMGKSFNLGGGKTGFYRRIWFDRPCPTLVTSPTMPATYLCHPTEVRPLSVEEYKRVQGFPDDYRICGDLTDQYKQIGNAVPLALGEAIGRTILADMEGRTTDARWDDFPYSRYRRTNDQTWQVG